jgi:hypothetical protein
VTEPRSTRKWNQNLGCFFWQLLEQYIEMFARPGTDRGRDRDPEIPCHLAPHKPFHKRRVPPHDGFLRSVIRKDLFEVVTQGAVKIGIYQSYPLAEASRAHRDVEARKTTGLRS